MSVGRPRHLSEREVIRSFLAAAQRVKPQFTFQTDVTVIPGYRADVVASFGESRLVVECENSSSEERLLESVYKLAGAINLHPEAFGRAYLAIPMEATRIAGSYLPPRVGLIGFTVDEQVRFHVIRDGEDFPPNFSAPLHDSILEEETGLRRVDVTAPKSFRIVRRLIEHPSLTQSTLAEEAEVSLGLVNKVVSYLSAKRIVEVGKKGVTLSQPWKLLSEVALARPMESLKMTTIQTSLRKVELVEEKIHEAMKHTNLRYVLALFSAARRHSSYFTLNDVVQLYTESPKAVATLEDAASSPKNRKRPLGGVRVEVYRNDVPDIFLEAEEIEEVYVTPRVQTIIDLVCAGSKGYELATVLFEGMRR